MEPLLDLPQGGSDASLNHGEHIRVADEEDDEDECDEECNDTGPLRRSRSGHTDEATPNFLEEVKILGVRTAAATFSTYVSSHVFPKQSGPMMLVCKTITQQLRELLVPVSAPVPIPILAALPYPYPLPLPDLATPTLTLLPQIAGHAGREWHCYTPGAGNFDWPRILTYANGYSYSSATATATATANATATATATPAPTPVPTTIYTHDCSYVYTSMPMPNCTPI